VHRLSTPVDRSSLGGLRSDEGLVGIRTKECRAASAQAPRFVLGICTLTHRCGNVLLLVVPGKSLFGGKSSKIVEERRVGLIQYLKQLFTSYSVVLEDEVVATFFDLVNRLGSEIALQVRLRSQACRCCWRIIFCGCMTCLA
jgi:PX domain